jgi:hypothetical protein
MCQQRHEILNSSDSNRIELAKKLVFDYENKKRNQYRLNTLLLHDAYDKYKQQVHEAKRVYLTFKKQAEKTEAYYVNHDHLMPKFERLYANINRLQTEYSQGELKRNEILKNDKKLRKTFTNLPLWVSYYIRFAFILSVLWILSFVIFEMLYLFIGGKYFSIFG